MHHSAWGVRPSSWVWLNPIRHLFEQVCTMYDIFCSSSIHLQVYGRIAEGVRPRLREDHVKRIPVAGIGAY